MKKSEIQGELWGKSPNGWAEVQEILHKPLWSAMLNATNVGTKTTLLDVVCGAGGCYSLDVVVVCLLRLWWVLSVVR